MATLNITIADIHLPKIAASFTDPLEAPITLQEARRRAAEFCAQQLRNRCKDIDLAAYKANEEKYNDITGE